MEDKTACELIIKTLKQRDRNIATCESLTGGLIGAALTSVPGASAVYRGGLITYARDLKVSLAGVDADFIKEEGVVNEATAVEMASGTRHRLKSDMAIACTGVAGPDKQDGVDVGTVFIALAIDNPGSEDNVMTQRLDLTGDREAIRAAVVSACFELVVRYLSPVT